MNYNNLTPKSINCQRSRPPLSGLALKSLGAGLEIQKRLQDHLEPLGPRGEVRVTQLRVKRPDTTDGTARDGHQLYRSVGVGI
jgi:hypothetical protein